MSWFIKQTKKLKSHNGTIKHLKKLFEEIYCGFPFLVFEKEATSWNLLWKLVLEIFRLVFFRLPLANL